MNTDPALNSVGSGVASAEGASARCLCAGIRGDDPCGNEVDRGQVVCVACARRPGCREGASTPAICGEIGEGRSVCDLAPHGHPAYPHQDSRTGYAWIIGAARSPDPAPSEALPRREAPPLARHSEGDTVFFRGDREERGAPDLRRCSCEESVRLRVGLERILEICTTECGGSWVDVAEIAQAALAADPEQALPSHVEPERAGPVRGFQCPPPFPGDDSAITKCGAIGRRHRAEWDRQIASWTTLARDNYGEEVGQLLGSSMRMVKTMYIRHGSELIPAAMADALGPEPVIGAAYEDERGRLYTLERDPGGKAKIVVRTYADNTRHYEHELVWRDHRHRLVRMPAGGAA